MLICTAKLYMDMDNEEYSLIKTIDICIDRLPRYWGEFSFILNGYFFDYPINIEEPEVYIQPAYFFSEMSFTFKKKRYILSIEILDETQENIHNWMVEGF